MFLKTLPRLLAVVKPAAGYSRGRGRVRIAFSGRMPWRRSCAKISDPGIEVSLGLLLDKVENKNTPLDYASSLKFMK